MNGAIFAPVALARRFFLEYDRMAGVPGPTGT